MQTETKRKMPKKGFGKSLPICYLSKLKRFPTSYLPSNYQNAPRHPVAAADANRGATLSDVDRNLPENFGSLYSGGGDDVITAGPTEFTSPRFTDPPADVIRASKRFFVSPGPTGSLVEEARLSAALSSPPPPEVAVDGGGLAVTAVTADPYVDFRQSMREMVDARHVDSRGPLDWRFLEDLLACYLKLNERSVHECILRAFMDLTEDLRRQSEKVRREKVRDGKME